MPFCLRRPWAEAGLGGEGPDGENLHFCASQRMRSSHEKVFGALCSSRSVPMGLGLGTMSSRFAQIGHHLCGLWHQSLSGPPSATSVSPLPLPRQGQGYGKDPPHVAQRGPLELRCLARCPGGAVSRQVMSLNKN